jgi:hypothetical protein
MTTETLKHKASDSVAAEATQIIRMMYNQIKTCSYCLNALKNSEAKASETSTNGRRQRTRSGVEDHYHDY